MTPDEFKGHTPDSEAWLIVKRDLYYCPDACGYTGIRDHAGRYSHAEAKGHESKAAGVTILKLSEAPEFTGACFDDLARNHLRKQRDALLSDNIKLREALAEARDAIASLDKADLGYAERDGYAWPIRDELLSRISTALGKDT